MKAIMLRARPNRTPCRLRPFNLPLHRRRLGSMLADLRTTQIELSNGSSTHP